MDRDPYDILGVARSASADELKSAYRKQARKYHPDVNTDPDAEQKFAEVQQAWDILSDPEKKAMFDRYGRVGSGSSGVGSAAGGGWGGSGGGADAERFSEIFEEMFGGGGGGSGGSPFGGGFSQAARPSPRRGVDHRRDLHVTFLTAAKGGVEPITLDNGSSVQLRIPAGIEHAGTLRLRGKGGPGGSGGEAGDLLVTVRIGAHPLFTRTGLDLHVDVPITIAEAVTGTAVELTLLSGTVKLRIPPGTSSGTKLRISGYGVAADTKRTGDLFAVVQIVAPSDVSASTRASLEAMDLGDPRAAIDGMKTVNP